MAYLEEILPFLRKGHVVAVYFDDGGCVWFQQRDNVLSCVSGYDVEGSKGAVLYLTGSYQAEPFVPGPEITALLEQQNFPVFEPAMNTNSDDNLQLTPQILMSDKWRRVT